MKEFNYKPKMKLMYFDFKEKQAVLKNHKTGKIEVYKISQM